MATLRNWATGDNEPDDNEPDGKLRTCPLDEQWNWQREEAYRDAVDMRAERVATQRKDGDR